MSLKMKKKFICTVLALASVCCLGFGNAMITAKAENTATTLSDVVFKMDEGASVRVDSDRTKSGLRFVSYMTETDYDLLLKSEVYKDIEFGMLIAPIDYVTENTLDYDNVFGANAKYYFSDYTGDKTNKKEIIKVSSSELTDYTLQNDETAYKAFKGVIINVKEKNFLREFVGVGYVKAVKTDDTVEYKFPSTAYTLNQRSIVYMAQVALASGTADTHGTLDYYVSFVAQTDGEYKVLHYKQSGDTYVLAETETCTGKIGSQATAMAKTYENFEADTSIPGTKQTGVLYANGKTQLVLYYKSTAPVEIATADEFMTKLAANPAGNYKLTADIDLTSKSMTQFTDLSNWNGAYGYTANNQLSKGTVYAYLNTFSGTLDGNGHKIILNNASDKTNVVNALRDNIKGLFNEIASGAVVKNVAFDIELYAYLLRSGISIQSYNALLAGVNRGTIENCYVDGMMTVFGHTNYTGEFTAAQLGTYVIGDQQGTVKDTLINYNIYLTRSTAFTGGTLLETRAVFANFPGKAANAVYQNVIVVSASQTDYFGTYRYADGFRYLNEGTVSNCYMYTSFDNLMSNDGLACAKSAEKGTATTEDAFANLNSEVFTTNSDNKILFFDVEIASYQVIEKIATADEFMTKLAANPAGNYKLTADIDLTSKSMTQFTDLSNWNGAYGYTANNQLSKGTVYAYLNTFSGTLDGNGHKIILNNASDKTNVVNALRDNIKGLFNEIASGAVVKNVAFDIELYAYLLRSGISIQSYNALLAGVNRGTIENCYVDGMMTVFGHTNYTGEFTAAQLGTYVIGDQQGTVKDTLINYNIYLTRSTAFTGGTLLETRAVFANFPGKAANAVYQNVIVVSASQTDYFGTYRYADGFRYLNEGTVSNCYMYTSFDNLIAGSGLLANKGVEKGTASTVKAFANLSNELWGNVEGTLYFGNIALN